MYCSGICELCIFKDCLITATGTLIEVKPQLWFESFAMNDFSVVPFHFIVVLGTLLTTILGVNIEKTNKIMMPLFFILFTILAVRIAFIPNVLENYSTMFAVDFDLLLRSYDLGLGNGASFFSPCQLQVPA